MPEVLELLLAWPDGVTLRYTICNMFSYPCMLFLQFCVWIIRLEADQAYGTCPMISLPQIGTCHVTHTFLSRMQRSQALPYKNKTSSIVLLVFALLFYKFTFLNPGHESILKRPVEGPFKLELYMEITLVVLQTFFPVVGITGLSYDNINQRNELSPLGRLMITKCWKSFQLKSCFTAPNYKTSTTTGL